ncbi:hypothetical protein ABB02_01505 [Clostridiaceae bacterium JG1575]|nr:hypothetical protein ABB02_01505 [Clostridiaceae bacterium JG1575]
MTWKKPRSVPLKDQLYADRCMLKWQGMLLSDHNERIDYEKDWERQRRKAEEGARRWDLDRWDELILDSLQEKTILCFVLEAEEGAIVCGSVLRLEGQALWLKTDRGPRKVLKQQVRGIEPKVP